MAVWTVAQQKNGKVTVRHLDSVSRQSHLCGEVEEEGTKLMEWVIDQATHGDVIKLFDRRYVVLSDPRHVAQA